MQVFLQNLQKNDHVYEDWTQTKTSRVLTRKTAPLSGGHVFQLTGIIFELSYDIIGTNILTKVDENWTINLTTRVLTSLDQDIIGKNLWTKFHEDQTRTDLFFVAQDIIRTNVLTNHVLQQTGNIFELIQDIIKTRDFNCYMPPYRAHKNVLTKFHEDYTINETKKNAPPPVGHVFQSSETIFELVQDIIGTNLLTKFHEDPTINVASTVSTRKIFMTHNGRQTIDKRFYYSHKTKNAPPPGGHDFQPAQKYFKLVQDIRMNLPF
ncbi:hypothetical protein DPMN_050074 [Dreissena polymorpha]|uniref:Uncharacterized protein n=1 Tax=Dreissena polymorpha TaxID=45954 RepID=A0A9D4CGG4_DREPO|nr:hypothetical protein DPMN_050074 [Dreissena polymorpha]